MSKHTIKGEISTFALTRVQAFSQLKNEALEDVRSRCRIRHYDPGQEIISFLDNTRDVFFVINGSVQAINILPTGSQLALQSLESGDMFGELSALDGAPRSAYIFASSEALVASMSAADFHAIQKKYPSVNEVLIKRLVGMVRHLCERIFERDALPAGQRVRMELLRRALHVRDGNNSAVLDPAPSHSELANHASTSRETVTRHLTKLRQQGVVEKLDSKTLRIPDVLRLAGMVDSTGAVLLTDTPTATA